ncbi:hypothetical protein UY3_00713 [Chelonia mydas]|uniref:Uncharacterized protein n=1 Tax=Chelonia mydas TaxID=8469 RepID=M7BXQ8_CHEMY|nr:hypothetical protein UY3_00713 [Chelonia mydas]
METDRSLGAQKTMSARLCCTCSRWRQEIKEGRSTQLGLAEKKEGYVLQASAERTTNLQTPEAVEPDYAAEGQLTVETDRDAKPLPAKEVPEMGFMNGELISRDDHAELINRGDASTTTPPLYVDSCKGGVSCNRDENFGDEEDYEDAEDETILPDSQELFFTLDLVPSQPTEGGLPDHEGEEGTSDGKESPNTLFGCTQGSWNRKG